MDSSVERRLFDRRLYFAISILFPALVLLGFARTYYLKGLFATPPLPSGLVHLHGLVMTAWVALFVVQVRLVHDFRDRLQAPVPEAAALEQCFERAVLTLMAKVGGNFSCRAMVTSRIFGTSATLSVLFSGALFFGSDFGSPAGS